MNLNPVLPDEIRETGLAPIGTLPWGAHICLFFETADDLLDTHASYFQAGLESSEICVWAISQPLSRQQAIDGMRSKVPDFDRYLADGRIELISGYEWYLLGDPFAPDRITAAWHAKRAEALSRGYAGLRVSGNAFWFESDLWQSFKDYETALDRSLEGQKMIVLCTYPLARSRATDLLEVARAHQFSVARRNGRWDFLYTPKLSAAKWEPDGLGSALDLLSEPFPGDHLLTPRERAMLAQMSMGASNKEAARALDISPRTAEFHRRNILRKLGVRNLAGLLAKVLDKH